MADIQKVSINYLELCSFVLATGHKVAASLLFSLTGSGNMAVSHPIAASTPEGSNYGAIGISYNESVHASVSLFSRK